MRRFDITKFVILVLFFCFLVSCDRKKTVSKENVEQVKKNTENPDAVDDEVIHANLSYFDFDRIENLSQFFDSIAGKHGIPIRDLGGEEHNERYVYDCIKRIENFRRGIVKFYPDDAVRECISLLGLECAFIANHACSIDIAYAEWFLMCAAYYAPDISYLVDMQSSDHLVEILNFGQSYNYNPWWAYFISKHSKGYEVRCLGDETKVNSLFQLEDKYKRKYYLCSNNSNQYEFLQELFFVDDFDNIIEIAKIETVPNQNMADEFDTYFFKEDQMEWFLCKWDKHKQIKRKSNEMPILRLKLDGENSKFVSIPFAK